MTEHISSVYIAKSPGWKTPTGKQIYKVGYSKKAENRRKNLQTPNPYKVDFVQVYDVLPLIKEEREQPYAYYVEQRAHSYLRKLNYGFDGNGGTEFFVGDELDIRMLVELAIKDEEIQQGRRHFATNFFHGDNVPDESSAQITIPAEGDKSDTFEEPEGWQSWCQEYLGDYRPYQVSAIEQIVSGQHSKGIISIPPAGGKGKIIVGSTFVLAYSIATTSLCLILVPTIHLVDQIYEQGIAGWQSMKTEVIRISNEHSRENMNEWVMRIKSMGNRGVVISTYQSSIITKLDEIEWNLVLCDEAHHIAIGKRNTGDASYYQGLVQRGKFKRIFFFTATMKCHTLQNEQIEDDGESDTDDEDEDADEESEELLWSMNKREIFGPVISKLTLLDAIQQGYVNDYNVVLQIYKTDKENALVNLVRMIGTRILIKCSRIETVHKLVTLLRKEYPDWYVDCLVADTKEKERKIVVNNIRSMQDGMKALLVICEVYSEGWNEPSLDTVVLYDCPDSELRLIQVAGRVYRKYPGKEKGYVAILCSQDEIESDKRKLGRLFRRLLEGHPIVKHEGVGKGGWRSLDDVIIHIQKDRDENEVDEKDYMLVYDRGMNMIQNSTQLIPNYTLDLLIEFAEKIGVPKQRDTWNVHGSDQLIPLAQDVRVGQLWADLKRLDTNKRRRDYVLERAIILQQDFDRYLQKKDTKISMDEKESKFIRFITEQNRLPARCETWNIIYTTPEDQIPGDWNIGQWWDTMNRRSEKSGDAKTRLERLCSHSQLIANYCALLEQGLNQRDQNSAIRLARYLSLCHNHGAFFISKSIKSLPLDATAADGGFGYDIIKRRQCRNLIKKFIHNPAFREFYGIDEEWLIKLCREIGLEI